MGTKISVQPTKTEVNSKFYDPKAGDKINLDLQGYVKHKDILSGKPLKGSKVKAKAKYKKGRVYIRCTARIFWDNSNYQSSNN